MDPAQLPQGSESGEGVIFWRVVIVRLATHPPTQHHMARRTQEGMSKPEISRCLKRYVAREIYRELTPRPALAGSLDNNRGITRAEETK
jgi:transposase